PIHTTALRLTHHTLQPPLQQTFLPPPTLLTSPPRRSSDLQAFYIPSDSMVPTLKTDDRVIVNKLSYHLHAVHRGDIVVFKTPKDSDGNPIDPTIKDLVKRVIGLPGETVGERDGQILINGKVLKESYLPPRTIS